MRLPLPAPFRREAAERAAEAKAGQFMTMRRRVLPSPAMADPAVGPKDAAASAEPEEAAEAAAAELVAMAAAEAPVEVSEGP